MILNAMGSEKFLPQLQKLLRIKEKTLFAIRILAPDGP